MAKRQKVFLGAYVNSINAQNLNCRALALHIDSKRFKCSAMELQKGELSSLSGSIKFLKYAGHIGLTSITLLRGILWADVVYLPKREVSRWCRFLCWLFKKPSFSTMESVDEGANWDKQLKNLEIK